MSLRVGIDLVSADSVRDSIQAHGERYLSRVFTARELAECTTVSVDPRRLAARVAAKEAAFKVLEVGPEDPILWAEVELRRGADGPELALSGTAAHAAKMAGIKDLVVSLTETRGTAGAIVIAELPASDR